MLIRDDSASTQRTATDRCHCGCQGRQDLFSSRTASKGATEMADKKPAAAKKETAAPKSTKAKEGAKAAKPAKKK
jgi:hypothetical protein